MQRTKNLSNPLSDYDLVILELLRSHDHLRLSNITIEAFGLISAALLGCYLNKLYQSGDPEGWFRISYQEQCKELNIGKSVIRAHKQELIDRGVIISKMKGMPSQEFLKFDLHVLTTILVPVVRKSNEWQDRISSIIINNNLIYPKEDITCLPISDKKESPKKDSAKERNEKYLPLAKFLSKIVQSQKNMKYTPQQIAAWCNDIRQLSENNGISIERIRSSLIWYRKHVGGQYIPVIESGKSLKEKFVKLEAAMEREERGFERKDISSHTKKKEAYGDTWYLAADGEYYNDEGEMLRD